MTTGSWRSLAVAAALFTGMALPASAVTITCPGGICANGSVNIGDVGANPTALTGQFQSGDSTKGFFFTDYVTFNLTNISPVFLEIASATNPFTSGTGADTILNFRVTLFSGAPPAPGTGLVQATTNAVYPTGVLIGVANINTAPILLTAPGAYFLLFEGAGGNLSGFSGVVTTTPVNPIPLPGALTLFGTGLVGLWALRRRRNKQQVAA
jgi:hypothetical protein